MARVFVARRETGDFIHEVESIEEGLVVIERLETIDQINGDYEERFYDLLDEEHISLIY